MHRYINLYSIRVHLPPPQPTLSLSFDNILLVLNFLSVRRKWTEIHKNWIILIFVYEHETIIISACAMESCSRQYFSEILFTPAIITIFEVYCSIFFNHKNIKGQPKKQKKMANNQYNNVYRSEFRKCIFLYNMVVTCNNR